MAKYNGTSWHIDNGAEKLWKEPTWSETLKVLSNHPNGDPLDAHGSLILDLMATVKIDGKPGKWVDGTGKPELRDQREAWTLTEVATIENHISNVTQLGSDFVNGLVTRRQVFIRFFRTFQYSHDYPYRIIATAFLVSSILYHRPSLTLRELIVSVMLNYRPNADELKDALEAGKSETIPPNADRRMRNMARVLEQPGIELIQEDHPNTEGLLRSWRANNMISLTQVALGNLIIDMQTRLKDAGLVYEEQLLLRFCSSMLARRFVILSGLAGSGKTKLAISVAKWLATNPDEQIAIIPIGADWTSNENIVGYPDALNENTYISTRILDFMLKAGGNLERPYFLILDEMNLSHVERYFSDFLSAFESGGEIPLHQKGPNVVYKKTDGTVISVPEKIKLPSNLFIIGTINVDETTYQFSPKVLDRANTIEFTISSEQMENYLNFVLASTHPIEKEGTNYSSAFVQASNIKATDMALRGAEREQYKAYVMLFFDVLKHFGVEFGFRTAGEIERFITFHRILWPRIDGWTFEEALDAQILQKMLPKLNGSRKKLEPVLYALSFLCKREYNWSEDDFEQPNPLKIRNERDTAFQGAMAASLPSGHNSSQSMEDVQQASIRFKLSYEKICRMVQQLERNGFTSFAEA